MAQIIGMEKGIVPCSGIDTDARWGYSHTKGWIFGYKLHLTCTTGKIVVPLTADVTTANVQDNQMYVPLTSSSSSAFSLPYVSYMIADQAMTIRTCTSIARRYWE